jgi:hypothetical protein
MRFQAETKDVILQRMVNKVVARSELTDLVSTSQLLQVLAASARAIEKVQQGMEDIATLTRSQGQIWTIGPRSFFRT